jgi:hypothetical protein
VGEDTTLYTLAGNSYTTMSRTSRGITNLAKATIERFAQHDVHLAQDWVGFVIMGQKPKARMLEREATGGKNTPVGWIGGGKVMHCVTHIR